MEKMTIYDTLKNDGARLKPANFYTQEQLKELYAERFGEEKPSEESDISAEEEKQEIHTLYFPNGGWSDELKASFAPGYYRPASIEEYRALKKHASREV